MSGILEFPVDNDLLAENDLNPKGVIATPPITLLTNLEAYWKLDQASYAGVPGEVIDSSPNGFHGTWSGAPIATVPSLLGTALDWTPVPPLAQVLVPDHPILQLTSGDASIQFWIKFPSGHTPLDIDKFPLSKGTGFAGWNAFFAGTVLGFPTTPVPAGALVFDTFAVGSAQTVWPPGIWNHIMLTHQAGVITHLYVNGSIQFSNAISPNPPPFTAPLGMGQSSAFPLPSALLMDEIAIWSRALTGPEVATLYNGGIGQIIL